MSITNGVFLFASVIVTWGMVQHFFGKVKSLCSTRGVHIASGICMMLIIIAGCAISSHSPMLMDAMTLTATGENRPEAIGNEIWFLGYTIDGKEYVAGKDLEIENGKWFWIGENYCWRDKRDPHQPEGVTSAVTVKIPVGKERTLHFGGAPQRGKIKVEIGDAATVFDTYHETPNTFNYGIAPSARYRIVLNYMIRFLVYGLSIFFMMYIGYWVLRKKYCNPQWWEVYSGRVGCAAISVFVFVLMMYFADGTEFWFDELLQIESSIVSIKELIQLHLMMYDATPPFYSLCAWGVYRIIPYGERWILLLPIFVASLSCYFLGRVGEMIGDESCGVLASSIMGFSSAIWHFCAYNHRAYSFLTFFTVLAIYSHICRNGNKHLLWYTFSLVGLVMSHYFGAIVAGGLFLLDRFCFHKNKWYLLKMYFIPGSIYCTWLFFVYQKTLSSKSLNMIAAWYPSPDVSHVGQLIYALNSCTEILVALFVCGMMWLSKPLFTVFNRNLAKQSVYRLFLIEMVFGSIFIIFCYGNFISPYSTMWTDRYFVIILPCIYLIDTFALLHILHKFNFNISHATLAVIFVSILHLLSMIPRGISQEFRAAAEYLYTTQTDYIFDKNTIIITTCAAPNGWNEYYISRRGKRDKLNVVTIKWNRPLVPPYAADLENVIPKYTRVYLQYSQDEPYVNLQNMLDEYYVLEQDRKNIKLKIYQLKSKTK